MCLGNLQVGFLGEGSDCIKTHSVCLKMHITSIHQHHHHLFSVAISERHSSLSFSTATGLWDQKVLHSEGGSSQHSHRPSLPQRGTLQGHGDREDRGGRCWWATGLLLTHLPSGSAWKCCSQLCAGAGDGPWPRRVFQPYKVGLLWSALWENSWQIPRVFPHSLCDCSHAVLFLWKCLDRIWFVVLVLSGQIIFKVSKMLLAIGVVLWNRGMQWK